jgi:hypothetical protein
VAHFDATSAECLVFTFKEGLLAAVAHDLKIRVAKFVIDVDERTRQVAARFDAASLRVVCAMEEGRESPGTLNSESKRQIEASIVRDVLEPATYPEITFTSSSVQAKGDGYQIKGTLALHGKKRQVTVRVHAEGDRYVGEARISQPDFGMQPYSAMLGTLRVKPDVNVRVSVPAPAPGKR